MLSQEYRLRRKKDMEIAIKDGRFVGGALVTMKYWKIEPQKYPRREFQPEELKIGFVVGKKVSKSAVKRNRAKRQMREVVRLLLKENKIKKGFLVAFMAKPSVLGKTYQEIEKDMVSLLKRTGLIK